MIAQGATAIRCLRWPLIAGWLAAGCVLLPRWGLAQVSGLPEELAGGVHVDEAEASVRAQFERVQLQIRSRQWDEAVETLLAIAETSGDKLIAVGKWRFRSARDQCQAMLATMPDEGLAVYRRQIDVEAEQAIAAAKASGELARLRTAIDHYFCASPADAGLVDLVEFAAERGAYVTARDALERLLPQPPVRIAQADFEAALAEPDLSAADQTRLARHYRLEPNPAGPSYRLTADDRPLDAHDARWLAAFWRARQVGAAPIVYPDSRQDVARLRALWILISILAGELDQADDALALYQELHGAAAGYLAGAAGRYADRLHALLLSARAWAPRGRQPGWPTLGGTWDRAALPGPLREVGRLAWPPVSLDPVELDAANHKVFHLGTPLAGGAELACCYFPAVYDNTLYWCNRQAIFALDLRTGQPKFPRDALVRRGLLFELADAAATGPQAIGTPRFTLSAHEGRLYARLGSQATNRGSVQGVRRMGVMVCLDLATARLLWELSPGDDGWAFESEPIADGDRLYVAMRRSEVRPQLSVACYEQPGLATARQRRPKLLWRTLIGSAETPAGGLYDEITHQILTLHEGTLFCSSNLGVIGAVDASSGRLRWVTRYPRTTAIASRPGEADSPLLTRDLCPGLCSQGRLYCAPSDAAVVMALRESTGEVVWRAEAPAGATYLLGANRETLFLGGDQLRWLDAETGALAARWPDQPRGAENLRSLGRGILAGEAVLWPTREAIYVLDQRLGPHREPRLARQPIALAALHGASGGNLVLADGYLIVAAPDKMYAFPALGSATTSAGPRNAAPLR